MSDLEEIPQLPSKVGRYSPIPQIVTIAIFYLGMFDITSQTSTWMTFSPG